MSPAQPRGATRRGRGGSRTAVGDLDQGGGLPPRQARTPRKRAIRAASSHTSGSRRGVRAGRAGGYRNLSENPRLSSRDEGDRRNDGPRQAARQRSPAGGILYVVIAPSGATRTPNGVSTAGHAESHAWGDCVRHQSLRATMQRSLNQESHGASRVECQRRYRRRSGAHGWACAGSATPNGAGPPQTRRYRGR